MSTQANKTLIGAFVVSALVLAVAGVMIFGSGKIFATTYPYVLYFDGSVKGLNIGSHVVFRGAKLGTVTDIKLRVEGNNMVPKIPVFIELDRDRISEARGVVGADETETSSDMNTGIKRLVDKGLRARLEMQSMVTGQLVVTLDLYPDDKAVYRGVDPEYPELPTVASTIEVITGKFKKIPIDQIANELLSALKGIEGKINSPELDKGFDALNQTLVEARDLVKKLNEQVTPMGEKLEQVLDDTSQLMRDVNKQIDPVAASIEETLRDTQKLVNNVDGRVEPVSTALEGTLEDTRKLVRNVDAQVAPLSARVEEVAAAATAALEKTTETLAMVQGFAPKDSALVFELNKTLKSLSEAMDSLKQMTDYLERHPEALLKGKN